MDSKRQSALDRIKTNIAQSGFHLYIVGGGPHPRYAYTINLHKTLNKKLIMGGAAYYTVDDLKVVFHLIHEHFKLTRIPSSLVSAGERGTFTLASAARTWTSRMMLGALDYFSTSEIDAYQIVTDSAHHTLDIPDMSRDFEADAEPIWRWLEEKWPYKVPESSTATTNLDALRGERVTEVVRWEEDDWEMFAGPGPQVALSDARVVPLGCMLGIDASLRAAVDLEIGSGIWRDDTSGSWHPWKSK